MSTRNFSSIKYLKKNIQGCLLGFIVVAVIYLVISYSTSKSGTSSLVPYAPYLICMLIYGFGYIYCFGRLLEIRERLSDAQDELAGTRRDKDMP